MNNCSICGTICVWRGYLKETVDSSSSNSSRLELSAARFNLNRLVSKTFHSIFSKGQWHSWTQSSLAPNTLYTTILMTLPQCGNFAASAVTHRRRIQSEASDVSSVLERAELGHHKELTIVVNHLVNSSAICAETKECAWYNADTFPFTTPRPSSIADVPSDKTWLNDDRQHVGFDCWFWSCSIPVWARGASPWQQYNQVKEFDCVCIYEIIFMHVVHTCTRLHTIFVHAKSWFYTLVFLLNLLSVQK